MGKSYWQYPRGSSPCCKLIIVYTLLYSAAGITQSTCGSDNTVELVETRGDNNVTCIGFPNNYTVNWMVTLPTRTIDVGNCPPGSTSCTDWSVIGYVATRPFPDISLLTIDPRVSVDLVKNGTLDCQAIYPGELDQSSKCRLDIVSRPSRVTCTVQLDTNSVIGRCNVTKVYSYNGRYSCQWYTKLGSAVETKVNESVTLQTTPTTDGTPTGGIYIDVVCNVTLRKQDGDTFYSVVIFPGGVRHDAGKIAGSSETSDFCEDHNCLLFLLLLLLLLPIIVLLGYLIYVLVCWCIFKNRGSPRPGSRPSGWHPHFLCRKKTNDVFLCACTAKNDDECIVLICSKSSTGQFVCCGSETPSPRKSRQPEVPVELTTVRTSSPPQAATVPGDNQASGTPHGDDQASGTPRLRPLPEPSRMTSVERNSTAEYSNMLGRDKHPKLPPIGKPDNHP